MRQDTVVESSQAKETAGDVAGEQVTKLIPETFVAQELETSEPV